MYSDELRNDDYITDDDNDDALSLYIPGRTMLESNRILSFTTVTLLITLQLLWIWPQTECRHDSLLSGDASPRDLSVSHWIQTCPSHLRTLSLQPILIRLAPSTYCGLQLQWGVTCSVYNSRLWNYGGVMRCYRPQLSASGVLVLACRDTGDNDHWWYIVNMCERPIYERTISRSLTNAKAV